MANQKKDDKDKYVKTTISFEPEQYRQMISYCEREERSASWVIRTGEIIRCRHRSRPLYHPSLQSPGYYQ